MTIKNLMTTLLFVGSVSFTALAQNTTDVTTLLGKPITDPSVSAFITAQKLDAVTGLSYENGVQLFNDGQTVYQIYLFNKTTLNGTAVNAYAGVLPFRLTFKETPATLKTKIGVIPVAKGDHLVWDLKDYRLEVAFTDEKKTDIAYVVLEKK